MTNTTPTAATRTVTLTIRVPEGARWQTTDEDGEVKFWRERPYPADDYWAADYGEWDLSRAETNTPCPHWRDTLIALAPEPATKETT